MKRIYVCPKCGAEAMRCGKCGRAGWSMEKLAAWLGLSTQAARRRVQMFRRGEWSWRKVLRKPDQSIAAQCRKHGKKPSTVNSRLRAGYSLEDALTIPVKSIDKRSPLRKEVEKTMKWGTYTSRRSRNPDWSHERIMNTPLRKAASPRPKKSEPKPDPIKLHRQHKDAGLVSPAQLFGFLELPTVGEKTPPQFSGAAAVGGSA